MIDKTMVKKIMTRITTVRSELLMRYPFFGQLAMQMGIAIAPIQTAATDMKKLYFDPEFVQRLDDGELAFVIMHELMHCVLKHCTRGKDHDQLLFNIACDIVVNSNIMKVMGVQNYTIDQAYVMHLAPDRKEGYEYTAEQVYEMLKKRQSSRKKKAVGGGVLDNHDVWAECEISDLTRDQWDKRIDAAIKSCDQKDQIPMGLREWVDREGTSRVDWQRALQDFVQMSYDNHDYLFHPADRRFVWQDLNLPAFHEIENSVIDNIWFVVDVSGSIDDGLLEQFFTEIKAALEMFDHLSGKLSFFSTMVTEPVPFDSIEDIAKAQPESTGGTRFDIIFDYMKMNMADELPVAVVILTDGFAPIPPESAAQGVPVLWAINNDIITPDWGKVVRIAN